MLSLWCGIVAGCGGGTSTVSTAKPATVSAPVKESALATVTLSVEAERRLAVKTEAVERRAVPRSRTLGGEIIVPSGSTIAITAPVAGTLLGLESVPSAGSAVTRGQRLFQIAPIQPSERDAAVDAQQAADTAAARREAAALKVQRAERLVKDGSGSRRAVEEAQAELSVAEAEVKAASGRVNLARQSGSSAGGIIIEAPDTAIVQNVHVRAGQAVAANTPLIDLVRLGTVWIKVPVYAGEVSRLDATVSAQVLSLGDPPDADGVAARAIAAPPSANATTAAVDLYFAMANPANRFRPGERVAVRLASRESQPGLVVPKAALLHDAYGGTWVYIARQPQVYVRQRVVVTDVTGSVAVLSQGPAEGSRVVTDGAAELFGVEFGAGK